MRTKVQPDKRAAMQQQFLDIRTIHRMFKALSKADWDRPKSYDLSSDLGDLKKTYKALKEGQRFRGADPLFAPKGFIKKAEVDIRAAIGSLCASRKFNETISIGGAITAFAKYKKKAIGMRRPQLIIHVGYMWHRSVWRNLYSNPRMINNEHLVLSASEYRSNVPHVRLYQVIAYDFTEKSTVYGWVGQSKIGNQRWTFRSDMKVAALAATKLTVEAVNQKLIGEDHG